MYSRKVPSPVVASSTLAACSQSGYRNIDIFSSVGREWRGTAEHAYDRVDQDMGLCDKDKPC